MDTYGQPFIAKVLYFGKVRYWLTVRFTGGLKRIEDIPASKVNSYIKLGYRLENCI